MYIYIMVCGYVLVYILKSFHIHADLVVMAVYVI